ncbi:hypothetical protein [Dictyobacter arantiisoli]|uniref:Uncharacterized protein n=1 Tax=Dictyobacter arantiisoli TaxID=2014874 RepID=A0A5A5TJV4_9CHLR|nr:hypothetical protein [Dictyobacter arantiisoli]GCF11890.1 hypothetical protein KDI_54540 [Dictyobacter arantiisoli]
MSSRDSIVRQARDKGRERVQKAEDMRKNIDVPGHNQAAREEYAGRYRTEIEYTGDTVELSSYVQGKNVTRSCYDNYVRIDEESDKAHFVQQSNYKRRTPHYQTKELMEQYPKGCGKFDDEVEWKSTEPSSHGMVLFNQIESYQNYAREHNLPPLDLHPYEAVELVNRKDQALVNAFLGEGPGSRTFRKGDDGYYAMAGGDTGKAKWELSVHLGHDITHIEMAKEGGWMELPDGKKVENVEHKVYYYYK